MGVARVRRSALSACVTCPICRGLLREATAIAECLHTCELSLSPAPVALSRTRVFWRGIAWARVFWFGVAALLDPSFSARSVTR
jgi:hypothetical protein